MMKDRAMKEILRVEELEENKEELKEVAEDVFPVIVFAAILSGVLLFIFLLRLYIRWGVPCPSKNRLDGKTVIITGWPCSLIVVPLSVVFFVFSYLSFSLSLSLSL